jgi:hypothetical protein
MKNIIKKIKAKAVKGVIILFAILLVTPACDDRLDEINQNPGKIIEIPDDFLFARLVRESFRTGNGKFMEDYGAQYSHQAVSNTWVKSINQYMDTHMQGDVTESMFNDIYKNIIKYANDITNINTVDGVVVNEAKVAMTQIMALVGFAKLTDFFGDVPYFEAGLGKEEIFTPKYDKQEDIYADMVARLKTYIDILKVADASDAYPDQDPMYDNDLDKWVSFANSFRLRLAMRARFVDPGKYEPIIIECLGQPLIEENSQNAAIQHQISENGELYNPWYNKQKEYNQGVYQFNLSKMFVDWLKLTNDPRLIALVRPNPDGEFEGYPSGLSDIAVNNYIRSELALPSEFMLAQDQPLWIMTASEIWFLRAEAALFGIGTGGDAATMYQEGITKAMEQWQISQDEIGTYLSDVAEATLNGTQENQFRQIATQMWVAFAPNYQEAYSNIRRTGYPFIAQRTGPELEPGVTNGFLPKRVEYPYTIEKSLNGANMQEAIDRMGGEDKIDYPVWWDVRD